MGNLITAINRLVFNKTSVTIVGVGFAFVILVFSYKMRINNSIKPETVPYAKQNILAGTQITSKMVGTTEVPPSMLEGEVLRTMSSVVDRYANADTIIPKGSLFYSRAVVDKEDLPANIILDYPKGYVLYNMAVDTETTYGNSIYPGNFIDIYMKVETVSATGEGENNNKDKSNDKVMLGKFLSNVKVIAVRDSDGNPLFENTKETRTPAMIIFAVPEEYYILLKKAEYLRTYSAKLIPVPTNESLKENPGEIDLSSEIMKEWINNVTVWTER